MMVGTMDQASGIQMFNEIKVTVQGTPITSVTEVTPEWLNFSPNDIYIDSNFLYVAANYNGLHVFNIQNPLEPIWQKKIDTDGPAKSVVIENGYAFVAVEDVGLQIIDVNPLVSASIIQTIPMGEVFRVCVWGGWAYVIENDFLYIVDVSPPEFATLEVTIDIGANIAGFYATNGYAYIAHYDGFSIYDVDPPSSYSVLKTIPTPDVAMDVDIYNGMAFVADRFNGVQVVDISVPTNASIVKNIPTNQSAYQIRIDNGYAYVFDEQIQILDIDPYDTAFSVKELHVFGDVQGVCAISDYAYVADISAGLHILDINPMTSVEVKKTLGTGALWVDVAGDYAYGTNGGSQFMAYSVSRPESARLVNSLRVRGASKTIARGGYAFVMSGFGLTTIDIDPADNMRDVGFVESFNQIMDFDYKNQFIYTVGYSSNLSVYSAVDPKNVSFIREITLSGGFSTSIEFAENGNFAYVTNSYGPLDIVTWTNIDIPIFVKSCSSFSNSEYVDEYNGYAYIADGNEQLRIVDVIPYESAGLVKTIDQDWHWSKHVVCYNNYAFVSCQEVLYIVDITTPETAYISDSINSIGYFTCADVEGKYLYTCDTKNGLRIFKLW